MIRASYMTRIASFRAFRFLTGGALFTALLLLGLGLASAKLKANVSSNSSRALTKAGVQCPNCAPRSNQIIYSPLVDLPEAQGSEIVFNSRSPQEIDVIPIFYKANGAPIQGEPVRIQPTEIRFVDLKTLIPSRFRNDKDWGGMSLAYTGASREVWAQLKLININRGGSVDTFFAVPQESRSSTLESVWWMPRDSTAIIALGNITDSVTSATVTFGDGRSRQVVLAPHATEVMRYKRPSSAGSESVSIGINGAAGSVIPTGIITSAYGDFNSIIRFYDPKAAKQSHLFGNGLRLKGSALRMILKNTTAEKVTATPRFTPLTDINRSNQITLSSLILAPGEVIEADLSQLPGIAERRSDILPV